MINKNRKDRSVYFSEMCEGHLHLGITQYDLAFVLRYSELSHLIIAENRDGSQNCPKAFRTQNTYTSTLETSIYNTTKFNLNSFYYANH